MPRSLVLLALACAFAACGAPARRVPIAVVPLDSSPLAPKPVLAVARPGDPDEAVLAQARLVPTPCAESAKKTGAMLDAHVAAMRTEVDASFEAWKRSALQRCSPDSPTRPWGEGIGESFAQGGLGTTGSGRTWSMQSDQVPADTEADVVKTDGTNLFVVARGALHVVDARTARVVSVTKIEGEPQSLLLVGHHAVVLTATGGVPPSPCVFGVACTYRNDAAHTRVVVLDVADPARPQPTRQLELSGVLRAARARGGNVLVVSSEDAGATPYEPRPKDLRWCSATASVIAVTQKRFERLKRDNERVMRTRGSAYPTLIDGANTRALCDTLDAPLGEDGSFTTLASFDVASAAPAVTRVARTPEGFVYASRDRVYLAVGHTWRSGHTSFFAGESDVTAVHAFDLTTAQYTGAGLVPGRVMNRGALDEFTNVLRVATTRGREHDHSAVSMLLASESGNLVRVGAAEHLMPGEALDTVRFDADRAYVVARAERRALLMLDLHDPTAPRPAGLLRMRAEYTYVRRVDRARVLMVGPDVDGHGLLAELFDVADPLQPKVVQRSVLGDSVVASNPLAFAWVPERQVLAIPVITCVGDALGFSGVHVFTASVVDGLEDRGTIEHGVAGTRCDRTWHDVDKHVARTVIVGDRIFSIAGDRMKMQSLLRPGTDEAVVTW
jgi:hypothetical protein